MRFLLFYLFRLVVLLSFNSLYEILRICPQTGPPAWPHAFNSLYEILVVYKTNYFQSILHFQFSLWDSREYWMNPFFCSIDCFQFSLWDSFFVENFHVKIFAFNSLYEIHQFLYSIQLLFVLSILFMRFIRL